MANKIESIEAKKQILSSEFHQYYVITLDKEIESSENQFVNVVIPFEKILDSEDNYGLNHLISFFNEDYSNILITNADNFNVIHQFECYNNVLFIRLKPYSQEIALHIINKSYDAMDNILFLKDKVNNISDEYSQHNGYYNYYEDEEHSPINLYYSSKNTITDEEHDRLAETKPYPEFSKFDDDPMIYYRYTEDENESILWLPDDYQNQYYEFDYDIRNRVSNNMQNIQINVGYRYNDSCSSNIIHYIGTKDITNINPADRCGLIDTNFDNITQETNVIEQFEIASNYSPDDYLNQITFPTEPSPVETGFTHNSGLHSDNIGNLYHKTVKYYNDEIYSEEFDGEETQYMNAEWVDIEHI